MQAVRRLPRAVAHAGDVFAVRCRSGCSGTRAAVARDDVPRVDQAAHFHLQPLERAIDVAHRAAGAGLPRRARATARAPARSSTFTSALRDVADAREAELEVRREPLRLERIAAVAQIVDDVAEILPDEVRQHEAVVHLRAPAHQRLRRRASSRTARRAPRSSSCCARLIRACGGISKARISTRPRRPVALSGE